MFLKFLRKIDLFKYPKDEVLVGSPFGGIISISVVLFATAISLYLIILISGPDVLTTKTENLIDDASQKWEVPPFIIEFDSNYVATTTTPYMSIFLKQITIAEGVTTSSIKNLSYGTSPFCFVCIAFDNACDCV